MPRLETVTVTEEMEGERLDLLVSGQIEFLSRGNIKSLIQNYKILVDGQFRKASYRVKEGEKIDIEVPEPKRREIIPRDIPLEIIYQDLDLAVVNKPKGLVVHPGHGNWDYTLVNALLYHIGDLSGINGENRPGIVHRLDKDTSGVLVVAKNDRAHLELAEQIKLHKVNREYLAVVHGVIGENLGTIEAPIERSKNDRKKMMVGKNGKTAISEYMVLERFKEYTLVKVRLVTGRTHQIRVHFDFIGYPVVGDSAYGGGRKIPGINSQMLHAKSLGFTHPTTGQFMEFESPLPQYFQAVLSDLKLKNSY